MAVTSTERPGRLRDVAADQRDAVRRGERQQTVEQPARTSRRPGVGGSASESSAARGAAPIAARSLRLTASARCPIASGGTKRRSKWTPSTCASVVRTSSAPRCGLITAASSPGPTTTHEGIETRACDALDERTLADVSDSECVHSGYAGADAKRGETQKPRFAVWGGRMNLRKQVEPLLLVALQASSKQRHAQHATSRLTWVLRWLRRASENHHEQSRSSANLSVRPGAGQGSGSTRRVWLRTCASASSTMRSRRSGALVELAVGGRISLLARAEELVGDVERDEHRQAEHVAGRRRIRRRRASSDRRRPPAR